MDERWGKLISKHDRRGGRVAYGTDDNYIWATPEFSSVRERQLLWTVDAQRTMDRTRGIVHTIQDGIVMENANLMRRIERMVRHSKEGVLPCNVTTEPFHPARSWGELPDGRRLAVDGDGRTIAPERLP